MGSASTGQALAPPPPPADTFIPTPDAQGIVANYEDMYPKRKFKALSIQRFSDTPEESIRWGLQPKSYTMDERDATWLEQHNQQARGEGTSASGGSAQTSPRRSSKKGKEPEDFSPIVMTEDEFELVMGLFEKYTSDHLPYLHLVRVPSQPNTLELTHPVAGRNSHPFLLLLRSLHGIAPSTLNICDLCRTPRHPRTRQTLPAGTVDSPALALAQSRAQRPAYHPRYQPRRVGGG